MMARILAQLLAEVLLTLGGAVAAGSLHFTGNTGGAVVLLVLAYLASGMVRVSDDDKEKFAKFTQRG